MRILINASFDRDCVRNGMALAMVMAMAMTMAMTTAIITDLSSPRPRRSRGRGRGVTRTSQYAYEGHRGVRAQRFLNCKVAVNLLRGSGGRARHGRGDDMKK